MKRIPRIAILLALLPAVSHADSHTEAGAASGVVTTATKLGVGLGVGLNAATLAQGNAEGSATSTSAQYEPSVAGFLTFHALEYLALQTEFRYERKGSNLDLNGSRIRELDYGYLEIPLLARPQYPINDKMTVYGLAGLGFSFLITAESIDNDGNADSLKGETKSFDITGNFGLGASFAGLPKGGELRLEARFGRSLIDTDDSVSDVTLKHQVFSLFLSYQIYSWPRAAGPAPVAVAAQNKNPTPPPAE